MDKFLLVDVDDVLLDWFPAFKTFVENELNIIISEDRASEYSMQDWLKLPLNEIRDLIDAFDRNHESFGGLKSMRQAEIYLPKFYENGYKIVAITASSIHPPSMRRRKDNLVREFDDIFENFHFVDRSEEKERYLKLYASSFWIEDKISNAQLGHDLGHTGIVMRQLSNKDDELKYPHLTWVNDWSEIYNMINKN